MVPLLKAGRRNFFPGPPHLKSQIMIIMNLRNCQLANKGYNNLHDTWDHFYFKLITIYTEKIK